MVTAEFVQLGSQVIDGQFGQFFPGGLLGQYEAAGDAEHV